MENKISRLFEEQRINISEMSRKTGIAYGTLYDIAKGKTSFEKIGIGNLIKIANEFGMTVNDLIGDSQPDEDRYEIIKIYDELGVYERKALLACAEGIHKAYLNNVFDQLIQDRYENSR